MDVFILVTMEACTSVYKDGRSLLGFVAYPKHSVESTVCAML